MKRLCVAALSGVVFVLGTLWFTPSADAAKGQDKKKAKMDTAAEFKKLDANGDGKLSKEEFKKLEYGRKKQGKEGKADKVLDKLFSELDTDKDGFLSQDEFKKLPEKLSEIRKKKEKN